MKTTLICEYHENIGQCREEHADVEIERMNKQSNKVWYKDYSDQMFVADETDDEVHNPCDRIDGYCFVTCSNEIENW